MARTRECARLIFQPLEDRTTPATGGITPSLIALDFDPSRVATADVNGDGVNDTITVTKPGEVTRIKVFDGKDSTNVLIDNPFVFEQSFLGGGRVDAGDLDGDRRAEIVVSADVGGSGRVVVLRAGNFGQTTPIDTFPPDGIGSIVTGSLTPLASFFGIEDSNFRGGSVVAVEDMNGNGLADVIVGAGVGGGPRVAIYEGVSLARSLLTLRPTTHVWYQGNISRNLAVGDSAMTSIQIVDAGGEFRTLRVDFMNTARNTYAVSATVPGATVTVPATPVTFDTNGMLLSPANLTISISSLSGADPQNITLEFGNPGISRGITQNGGTSGSANIISSVGAVLQDGFQASTGIQKLVNDFFALPDVAFRGGISLDAGDVNGDGTADLIVGAGAGGGQRTRIISGMDIRANNGATATPLIDFLLSGQDTGNRLGVIVAYEPPYNDNLFGGLGVFGHFIETTTGKLTIAGATLYIGKNLPKPAGIVPDLDERVFVL